MADALASPSATMFIAPMSFRIRVVMAALCSSACAPGVLPEPQDPAPVAEPTQATFTAEQATRGQRTFTTICATCHGRNEFTGPIFALTWKEEPVGNLYEFVSTNMPQDQPGSLTPEEYAAVIAYVLQLNGLTPGQRELPADPRLLGSMRW
jgi:mono/diheme cytochrome c family protein